MPAIPEHTSRMPPGSGTVFGGGFGVGEQAVFFFFCFVEVSSSAIASTPPLGFGLGMGSHESEITGGKIPGKPPPDGPKRGPVPGNGGPSAPNPCGAGRFSNALSTLPGKSSLVAEPHSSKGSSNSCPIGSSRECSALGSTETGFVHRVQSG